MFTLLESKDEIASARERLVKTIQSSLKERATHDITYPSGQRRDVEVCTDGKYWYWAGDSDKGDKSPRMFNWFGIVEEQPNLHITVEVNIPYSGSNGRVAGFFAKDVFSGQTYLMHSGRVGGGTKGVGKSAFLAWGDHSLTSAVDSRGTQRTGIIVMPITGRGAISSALRYVDSIVEFKKAVRAGELTTPEFSESLRLLKKYYAEGAGRRTGTRKSDIDYISRHGDVVGALRLWRKRQGLPQRARIGKNVYVDLALEVSGQLRELYEVKTSTNRTDLYTALGQLMVHGDQRCRRVVVVPDSPTIPKDIAQAFARLHIEVLRFTLTETDVHFP